MGATSLVLGSQFVGCQLSVLASRFCLSWLLTTNYQLLNFLLRHDHRTDNGHQQQQRRDLKRKHVIAIQRESHLLGIARLGQWRERLLQKAIQNLAAGEDPDK